MSNNLDKVKIVMLKGEKGDQGEGIYNDAEVRSLIMAEARERASDVNSLQITKADKTDVATLESRMDEFASLPDGSTSGDAELLDIRVGADGMTHSSAGNAVRNQVSILDTNIDDLMTPTNSADIVTWVHGTITGANGTDWDNAPYDTTRIRHGGYVYARSFDYVAVGGGYDVTVYAYNQSGTYLGTWSGSALAKTANYIKKANLNEIGAYKYRFVLRKTSESAIEPSEGVNLTFYRKTDRSLIYDGKIADAESTGKIAERVIDIIDCDNKNLLEDVVWEQGTIYASTQGAVYGGENGDSATRIRTAAHINFTGINQFSATIESGYKYVIDWYDKNKIYLESISGSWRTKSQLINVPDGALYARFLVANTSDSAIDINMGAKLSIAISSVLFESIQDINGLAVNGAEYNWKLGTLEPNVGTEIYSVTRIRSEYIKLKKGDELTLSDTENYDHLVYYYDTNKAYLADFAWSENTIVVPYGECYVRILIRKKDNSTIATDEIETIASKENFHVHIIDYIEKTYVSKTEYDAGGTVPSYFATQLETAIETAKDNIFETGINGDSFVFLTDVHWQTNSKNSPALISKVIKKLNINKIICGGDLIGGGAKADNIDLMNDCVSSYKNIANFYCAFGNHDLNTLVSATSSDYFTKEQSYALMQKQMDSYVEYGDLCYFYFDNPTTKTRYICLDTGMMYSALGSDQRAWIESTLNSTPNGYHVIVIAHIIYETSTSYHVGLEPSELYMTTFMTEVCAILDNFNANETDRKVEAIFGGHSHIDADFSTTGGIPIILTDCDTRQTFTETSAGSGVANHAEGTINEQCFDIVSIDYDAKTIKCVRVGRGSNRTFTY